ncbi:MAG: potassium-transporting ATPase subunit C, partial [Hyphomicrobiaceae bacterium]
IAALRKSGARTVPADAVTTSASGLDPHISPVFAGLQVARVAAARAVSQARVRSLVERLTEHRFLGLVGEPRINVLRLNLALDAELPGGAG